MKKFIQLPVIYISYLFLLMLSLYHSNLQGQDFENGDFQTTSTCGASSECYASIECIDGWWYFDSYGSPIQDYAWANPSCLVDPLISIDEPCNTRGLWMQNTADIHYTPHSPHRYATNNPLYNGNPNALYKLTFTFLPVPSQGNIYIHVSGAMHASSESGSLTFLATNAEPFQWNNEFECHEGSIYFFNNCDTEAPNITEFPYLVFSISSETHAPIGEESTHIQGSWTIFPFVQFFP